MKLTNNYESVTATMEINFPDGKREIEMILKDGYDIEDCDENKVVVVNLKNLDALTGYFNGIDNDRFILRALGGVWSVGYRISSIENYYESLTVNP